MKAARAGIEPATSRVGYEVTPVSLLWKWNQRRTLPGVSCCGNSRIGVEPMDYRSSSRLTASEMELRRKPDGEGSGFRRIGGIRTRNRLFTAVTLTV
jgi:hypothetical protein